MALPRYLAQTRAEFTACTSPPEHMAWMACHFAPYGTGLTNLPPVLPPGSMVILNDRIPLSGHDPERIAGQLQKLDPACLLLDFQRPPDPQLKKLVRCLTEALPCPTGAPASCADNLSCPLFLPLPPPDMPIETYLAPWKCREIWLELSLDAMTYTVTEQGSSPGPLVTVPDTGWQDRALCCHYRICAERDRVLFDLWRTRQDLEDLLKTAEAWGVTKAVGLWQELG